MLVVRNARTATNTVMITTIIMDTAIAIVITTNITMIINTIMTTITAMDLPMIITTKTFLTTMSTAYL